MRLVFEPNDIGAPLNHPPGVSNPRPDVSSLGDYTFTLEAPAPDHNPFSSPNGMHDHPLPGTPDNALPSPGASLAPPYSPSGPLHLATTPRPTQHLTPAQSDSSPPLHPQRLTIAVEDCIGIGGTYEAYRARATFATITGTAEARVVVKFCDPLITGTPEFRDRLYGDACELQESMDAVIDDVRREATILQRLEHTSAVPRFYGLWSGQTADGKRPLLLVTILEDVGASFWPIPILGSSGNLLPAILDLYDTLHRAGVVHNDIQTRHVMTRCATFDPRRLWDYPPATARDPYSRTLPRAGLALPPPSLCLIDFESAVTESDAEYEHRLEEEQLLLARNRENGERRASAWADALEQLAASEQ
ncbi:hypothetical protein CcaverHIS002_0609340 [Cutaneotrichosporon cavernicola]|nr:hypothetical protein CcaverHIS002_0609340 [Cutaneotrichosporon cavernicola]